MSIIHKLDNFPRVQKILIFLVPLISWFGTLFVPFMNDDFQIILHSRPKNFAGCFSPFFSGDVSVYYWRPLVNTLHKLILYFLGFNPFIFHATNILIFVLCCYALYYLMIKLEISRFPALITTLIFSAMPVYEPVTGWIAGRGDSLAALFVLLSAINYINFAKNKNKKNGVFYILLVILGILTKEIAVMALFLPLISQALSISPGKKRLLFILSANLIVIIIYSTIRFLLLPGNPLSGPNATNLNIIMTGKNFGYYLFSMIIPFNVLLREGHFRLITSVVHGAFFIFIMSFFLISRPYLSKNQKRIIFFGLLWILLFILPMTGLFMRWYVIVSSFGLAIITAVITEEMILKMKRISSFTIIISMLILLMITDTETSFRWRDTGIRANNAIRSLNYLNIRSGESIYLWAVPDKINGFNAMKVGLEQAAEYSTGRSNVNVISPLRAELEENATIAEVKISEDHFKLYGKKCRFFPVFQNKSFFRNNEDFSVSDSLYSLLIRTTAEDGMISSTADITFKKPNRSLRHFVFNGHTFINLE